MLPSEEFRGLSEEVSSGVEEEGWPPRFLWLPLSSPSPLACVPAMLPSAVLSHGHETRKRWCSSLIVKIWKRN